VRTLWQSVAWISDWTRFYNLLIFLYL